VRSSSLGVTLLLACVVASTARVRELGEVSQPLEDAVEEVDDEGNTKPTQDEVSHCVATLKRATTDGISEQQGLRYKKAELLGQAMGMAGRDAVRAHNKQKAGQRDALRTENTLRITAKNTEGGVVHTDYDPHAAADGALVSVTTSELDDKKLDEKKVMSAMAAETKEENADGKYADDLLAREGKKCPTLKAKLLDHVESEMKNIKRSKLVTKFKAVKLEKAQAEIAALKLQIKALKGQAGETDSAQAP